MLNVLISTESRYPVNRKVIRNAVETVFAKETISSLDVEVSVLVCGSRKMKALTQKYLGDNKVHEVLSFPYEASEKSEEGLGFKKPEDGILRLGDIIISWPEVVRLAGEKNVMIDDELAFLVGHGVEHLLGKHHEE